MFQKINAYDLGRDRKKDFRLFLVAFALFALFGTLIQLCFGWYGTSNYVSTLLAFSYFKQGFMRRGLVGTLFDLLCRLVPAAQSYRGAFWFMWGMNAAYFFSLLAFLRWIPDRGQSRLPRGVFLFADLLCLSDPQRLLPVWGPRSGRPVADRAVPAADLSDRKKPPCVAHCALYCRQCALS